MDPQTGRLYTEEETAALGDAARARLVKMQGWREDIERVSRAVADLNRAERRKRNRAAGLRPSGDPK